MSENTFDYKKLSGYEQYNIDVDSIGITNRFTLVGNKTSITKEELEELVEYKHEYANQDELKKYSEKDYHSLSADEKKNLIEELMQDDYVQYKNCHIARSKLLYDSSDTLIKEISIIDKLNDLGYEVYLLPYGYARDSMNCYLKSADSITNGNFLEFKTVISTGKYAGQSVYTEGRKQADNIFISLLNETSEQKVVNNIYKVINEKKRLSKITDKEEDFSGLVYLNFEKDNNRTVLYQFDREGKALRLDNPTYENLKKCLSDIAITQVQENPATEHGSSPTTNILQELDSVNKDIESDKNIFLAAEEKITKNIIENELNENVKNNVWTWENYEDNTGHLRAPDGSTYFRYDWDTKEYMITGKDGWDSFIGAPDEDSSFSAFKEYAEDYVKNFIAKTENIKFNSKNIDLEEEYELQEKQFLIEKANEKFNKAFKTDKKNYSLLISNLLESNKYSLSWDDEDGVLIVHNDNNTKEVLNQKVIERLIENFENSIQENIDKKIESQLNGGMDDFLIEKEIEYNHMIESEEESEEESEILTDEQIAFLDDFNKKTKDMNMKIINKSYQYFIDRSELSLTTYCLECDDFTHKRLMDHLDSSYTPKKSKLNSDNEIPIIEFRKSLHPERFPDQILVGYFKKSPSGNENYDCSTVDDSFTKDITRMINETCNEYDSHIKENFNNIYKKMEKTGYKLNDYEKNIYNNFSNNLDELEYQKNLLNANYYIKYATSKLNNLNKENQEKLFYDFKKETGLNAELLMNIAEKACPDLPESEQLKLTGEDWWRKALNHAMTSGGETYIDPNKAIMMLEKNYIISPGSYENNFEDYFDNGKYADILSDNIFEVIKNSNEPGLIGFCNKDLDLNPLKSKTETLNHSSEIFKSSAEKILNQPENQLKKLEHEIFTDLDELEKNNVTSMTMEHISFIKEAVKEKINNNTNTNESTHKGGRK